MKKYEVVGAVIYDSSSDRFLVTMRGKEKHQGGLWEFPGGKVEPGESHREALVREIKEELKCTIEVENFIEDYTHKYPEFTVRLITYLCSLKEGKPQLTEHQGMRWVTRDELNKLQFPPADIPTVRKLATITNIRR